MQADSKVCAASEKAAKLRTLHYTWRVVADRKKIVDIHQTELVVMVELVEQCFQIGVLTGDQVDHVTVCRSQKLWYAALCVAAGAL